MALILIYNDQTETIDFTVTSNNVYCSIFDEICKVIIEKFNLSNLLSDYRMVYYDPLYDLWIGFNIHVTKRITEVIRHSTSKTLKIRIEQRQRNIFTSFVKEKTIDKVESKPTEDGRCAHLIIWLDQHIGNPSNHKQLKRDCRAMINTNSTNFIKDDDIDTLIQYNSFKYNIDSTWKRNSKYFIQTTNDYSCPFQCTLFTADNTDIFFEYLNMAIELTRSLSIIISEHFIKEILPIIHSREQKQLLPNVLFLYVLCSDIRDHYDWALSYIHNVVPKHLELFNDEKALFVRLLNDVSCYLTLEADKRRCRKENWHALQYYLAARQLFLNSLRWNPCYTLHELDHLDQLIKESENEITESLLTKFRFYIDDKHSELDDKIAQECAEILE